MDWDVTLTPGVTVEDAIRALEADHVRIKRILARREAFTDTIDWSAMTECDRDRALYFVPEDLETELWVINCDLVALYRLLWAEG
jgi:hypothetical protein